MFTYIPFSFEGFFSRDLSENFLEKENFSDKKGNQDDIIDSLPARRLS